MAKKNPSFEFEKSYWLQGITAVIGIDEVGRGAFAGPIIAAGVIYKPNFKHKFLSKVNDSKLLTSKARIELSKYIKEHSTWVIESVDIDYINKNGIGKANAAVLNNVIASLKPKEEEYFVLADGWFKATNFQKGLIGGDRLSLSIASASIIAKVYRDELMKSYAGNFPNYGFESNVGYGTKKHREAIGKYGLCELHRTSFSLNKFLAS
jgi:ribonuclease HII